MTEMRNPCKILDEKCKGKRSIGRLKHRKKDGLIWLRTHISGMLL
jgi:hypothetical protein